MEHYLRLSLLAVLMMIYLIRPLEGQDSSNYIIPENVVDTLRTFEMPQVIVVGNYPGVLKQIPGSLTLIQPKDNIRTQPFTLNELIRRAPGLNVTDEEGIGLRVNIGIRGLDPDRSRNVLMLEDGVPLVLNPYGEPEMYFSPSIDKIQAVEVLKGSGQIYYGPQTTGAVINFITQDPPDQEQIQLRIKGGQGGLFSGYVSYGNTIGKTGFVIYGMHKRASNLGSMDFKLTDIGTKIKIELSENSRIGLKIGMYDEHSNATYIGITQSMYERGDQDFVRMAPGDQLPIRRYHSSLTHDWDISSAFKLKTTAFAYTTSRNWLRQEFSSNPSAPNQTGVVWGDTSIAGDAIYMLNTSGNRNRQFEVAGIETRSSWKTLIAGKSNILDAGLRYMYERAFEQFITGAKADASAGNMRDNEVRTGNAYSIFVQDKLAINQKLSITAGLRLEVYDYERHILRGRFLINGSNQLRDTSLVASDLTIAIIPGAGVNYNLNENATIFAGIHRGFAPPRIKDALTGEGNSLDLDAELSTNYEMGFRWAEVQTYQLGITGFFMDFKNQIIPVSQSSGNVNATGLINGGHTKHKGLEFNGRFDFGKWWQIKDSYTLEAALTYVQSTYSEDRFVGSESVNVKGNKLPYAPEWLFWGAVGAEWSFGLGFQWNSHFMAEQFTDEINSTIPFADGRNGLIDSRWVHDLTISYKIPTWGTSFHIALKNISDERYIASRRPQGIRVGLPRLLTLGADFTF
ncbi:MAG: TonB-dependent receptor [Saprospiraceae bacterium]|nr:TonB-dependent receptor [Saprospiraceae bacterium]